MRLRSARTLVFSRESGGLLGLNFLTGSEFTCSPDLLTLLAMLDDWTEFDHVVESLPAMSRDELQSSIEALISVTAITQENSRQAEREEGYRANWTWGIPAALFHFSVEDREYISLEQAEEMQRSKLAEYGQPPLYLINNDSGTSVVKLPQSLNGSDLLKLMAKRRTVRSAAPKSISLRQLSDCLFAGLGITGEAVNCVGSLPLSMTPSGGARNPYEAYLYARSVEGLEPGFYHYSAFEHSLAKLEDEGAPKPSELMGGQDWADEMPCIIILCS